MTNKCLSEGDLRAYLDSEANTQEQVHIASCGGCSDRLQEIRSRADRVALLLSGLGERSPARTVNRPVRRPMRVATAIVAGAIAASIAFVFLPRSPKRPPVTAVADPPPALASATVSQPQTEKRKRRHHRRMPRQMPAARDENAMEAGYILRVALGPDEDPADVIVTPDGRIRGIRLLQ